ncbi:hypothetical protein BD289DRAFT_372335 [Coniella lustricola]|uniref:Uncharacterized protein n=1 Tax=Coniella lustricola TaxID=2025994 RepID=A0A2T3A2I1_9PEZI|nr:hypothetical protein BD289DRAFT_372335 [Coniella lustricola]
MGSNPDPEAAPQPGFLPYWQVNVPPSERQTDCPAPLRNLSAKDRRLIGLPDEEYRVQSWAEVVDIVRTGRLADFRRWPTELRRYREFIWRLNNANHGGGVMAHILCNRLQWTEADLATAAAAVASKNHDRSTLFACDDDYKILWNDWPYGIDRRIVHLVVWTKFELEDDAQTEDEIERFVQKTFSSLVAEDKLIWFKNPPSLKSIHTVEHIHVMLFDPDPEAIDRLTDGDRPHGQLLLDPIGYRQHGRAKNANLDSTTTRALM